MYPRRGRDGASLTIRFTGDATAIQSSSVTQGNRGGSGAGYGQAIGAGMFLGENTTIDVGSGNAVTITDEIGGAALEAGKNDTSGNRTDGGLVKTGDGTLTLSAANSYMSAGRRSRAERSRSAPTTNSGQQAEESSSTAEYSSTTLSSLWTQDAR